MYIHVLIIKSRTFDYPNTPPPTLIWVINVTYKDAK